MAWRRCSSATCGRHGLVRPLWWMLRPPGVESALPSGRQLPPEKKADRQSAGGIAVPLVRSRRGRGLASPPARSLWKSLPPARADTVGIWSCLVLESLVRKSILSKTVRPLIADLFGHPSPLLPPLACHTSPPAVTVTIQSLVAPVCLQTALPIPTARSPPPATRISARVRPRASQPLRFAAPPPNAGHRAAWRRARWTRTFPALPKCASTS